MVRPESNRRSIRPDRPRRRRRAAQLDPRAASVAVQGRTVVNAPRNNRPNRVGADGPVVVVFGLPTVIFVCALPIFCVAGLLMGGARIAVMLARTRRRVRGSGERVSPSRRTPCDTYRTSPNRSSLICCFVHFGGRPVANFSTVSTKAARRPREPRAAAARAMTDRTVQRPRQRHRRCLDRHSDQHRRAAQPSPPPGRVSTGSDRRRTRPS